MSFYPGHNQIVHMGQGEIFRRNHLIRLVKSIQKQNDILLLKNDRFLLSCLSNQTYCCKNFLLNWSILPIWNFRLIIIVRNILITTIFYWIIPCFNMVRYLSFKLTLVLDSWNLKCFKILAQSPTPNCSIPFTKFSSSVWVNLTLPFFLRGDGDAESEESVSYTHLTLPTILLV